MEQNMTREKVSVLPYRMEDRENGILPQFNFKGARFGLDVDYGVLRDMELPRNLIAISEMQQHNGLYELNYNSLIRNMSVFWSDERHDAAYSLDQMVKNDPWGMAKKYGLDIAQLPERDDQLQCNPALIAWRAAGNLPKIDVAEDSFTIDWAARLLHSDVNGSTVNLRYPKIADDGFSMEFFYDTKNKVPVAIAQHITELPENVVRVEIPYEFKLDPWAVGKEMDIKKMDSWLNQNPIRQHFTAKVTPLWQTYVQQMVIDNRNEARKQKQPLAEKRRNTKIKNRKRHGQKAG